MNKIFINFLSNGSCPASQTKVKLSIYCIGVTIRSRRKPSLYHSATRRSVFCAYKGMTALLVKRRITQ